MWELLRWIGIIVIMLGAAAFLGVFGCATHVVRLYFCYGLIDQVIMFGMIFIGLGFLLVFISKRMNGELGDD